MCRQKRAHDIGAQNWINPVGRRIAATGPGDAMPNVPQGTLNPR
jgi:hypothetical protein